MLGSPCLEELQLSVCINLVRFYAALVNDWALVVA